MKVYEEEDGPDVALRKLTQQFGVLGYVVLNASGKPAAPAARPTGSPPVANTPHSKRCRTRTQASPSSSTAWTATRRCSTRRL